jgi:cytoskeletal protein CcmA (bactofilin family)
MFKRIRIAQDTKDKNNPKRSVMKSVKPTSLTEKRENTTSISLPLTNGEKTIIGDGVIIEGKISGSGNLIINGLMNGDIDLEESNLTVGPKGRVEGEINVRGASINGQLNGKVNAIKTVNISQTANVCGEINAKSISIEDGALFNGKIELDREPSRKIINANQVTSKPDAKENNVSALPTSKINSK